MEYNLKHYAYIGDVVWEFIIRKLVIKKTQTQQAMHKLTTKYVCANFQAETINKIFDKLTEDELEIQKRGRNLKISINKKNNPAMHSLATSFETVLGYVYLEKPERYEEFKNIIYTCLEELI